MKADTDVPSFVDAPGPSPLTPSITVGVAATAAEREEIFRLRYRVYVEELGIYGHKADHGATRRRGSSTSCRARA